MLAVIGVGAAIDGTTPPSAPDGPFYVETGCDAMTFTSGYSAAFYLPEGFPNGIIKVTAMFAYSSADNLALTVAGHDESAFSLCSAGGSPINGTLDVNWTAWGW